MPLHPLGLVGIVDHGRHARASFEAALSGSCDSSMPASAFTISPKAQNVTPGPYGGERPSRQRISSGRRSRS